MNRRSYLLCLVVTLIGAVLAVSNDAPLAVQTQVQRFLMGNGNDLMSTFWNLATCSDNPEDEMTTIDMLKKSGYSAEEHFVTTKDGYILALHRIPGPAGSPTVLLHHALLESSFCWVIGGKEKGLAYILADKGYDVWMGNVRGNTYSKNHTTYTVSEPAFWNFSWHEMGLYDLPAEIEYITNLKNDKLSYIGHSMGTTMFYVMASERPDIAAKVKIMLGLAPVAFMSHLTGLSWPFLSSLEKLDTYTGFVGMSEFFPQNSVFKFAAKCVCDKPFLKDVCRNIISSTVGFNSKQFNTSLLPLILTHTPAGTSLKTIIHFAQGIKSKNFRYYDYGAKINKEIYNRECPPEYNISKIKVPIALFWSQNDYLSQAQDVKRLYDKLPNIIEMYMIDDPNFNHLDFLWGIDAPKLVYSRLIHVMETYRYNVTTT